MLRDGCTERYDVLRSERGDYAEHNSSSKLQPVVKNGRIISSVSPRSWFSPWFFCCILLSSIWLVSQ